MANCERDEIPMLLAAQGQSSADYDDPQFQAFASRTRSASMSIPSNSDSYQNLTYLGGHTGPLRSERKTTFSTMSGPIISGATRPDNLLHLNQGVGRRNGVELTKQKYPSFSMKDQNDWPENSYMGKNEHLLRSGQLGMCSDPYCTTCPSYYNSKEANRKIAKSSGILDPFHYSLYGDAKGWARRFSSHISTYIPGVMNPHAKFVQLWNKFFVISCLVAVFVDPLFFFLLGIQSDHKCLFLNQTMTTTVVVLRSLTDFIYLLHILLQFRLAYIAPESTVVGAGDLVDHPREIALNYLKGYFYIDLFIALPLPQIVILLVIPKSKLASPANTAKNLLRVAVLAQYIPRLWRFLPMLAGQSPTGLIFESAWANFVMNLLMFILSGHVVGSCWYLFGLQRVNQCLRDACHPIGMCQFMDCGDGDIHSFESNKMWSNWTNNSNASNCFLQGDFDYGIFEKAVNLTTERGIVRRYIYSLFWGFQQISTLAGNQTPSYFVPEVLFTMAIIGLGLLLFALLIGNMQNFLQALWKRKLEMSLRRRDVELWMKHRRLPGDLRRRVRQAERFSWAATRGVNEEMLLENLPEDLQREIRRHLFKFVKKVRIFALMDDPILDAVCEKLRQKTYIKGSKVLNRDGLIEKMVFIVRGKMQSVGEDGVTDLSEGDVCGEELLAWCLENCSLNKEGKRIRGPGHKLHSYRNVECLTNVEAFALRAADLEEVTRAFARFLRNPRVQGAIRYVSPYWRGLAATRIQVAWRYRKKCLTRADTAQS